MTLVEFLILEAILAGPDGRLRAGITPAEIYEAKAIARGYDASAAVAREIMEDALP